MRFFSVIFCLLALAVAAQEPKSGTYTAPITSLYSDTVPSLEFIPSKKKKDFKIKEKKLPKTMFYGIKTKRGYTVSGKGKARVTELFYFLPKYKEPDPYVPVIYWYHIKKKQIMAGPVAEKDQKFARLLHGPYVKKTTYELLEEGIFYQGTKHGRWEKYDKTFTLMDKTKFFRGWPKESMISYYDQDRKKIQEIIPIQNGVRTGRYFKFYESGLIQEDGNYTEDRKVGAWVEYYEDRKKRKRITQYPKDPYDTETAPVVMKEWDANGRITLDKASEEQMEKQKKLKKSNKQ